MANSVRGVYGPENGFRVAAYLYEEMDEVWLEECAAAGAACGRYGLKWVEAYPKFHRSKKRTGKDVITVLWCLRIL